MNPNLPDPGENGSAAEMDVRAAAKFRSRVVETARAAWITNARQFIEWHAINEQSERIGTSEVIGAAEQFESAAAEYLRNGGAK